MGKVQNFHNYDPENMKEALRELAMGAALINVVTKWNVPRTTLQRLRDQNYSKPERMGPPTVLDATEENILVKWVLELKDCGFPVSCDQLVSSVEVSFYHFDFHLICDTNRNLIKVIVLH